MQYWLIKTCWINKGKNIGLKEYYEVIKKVCKGKDGVEFLGLYRPLNEDWDWAYFLKMDNLDKWRELVKDINKLYADINDNVTKTLTRIYEGSDQYIQPPIPKKRDPFNYIFEEIMVWAGRNVGLDYAYSAWCEIFEEVEDGRLFGLYLPWTEEYNLTIFFMADSISRFIDLVNTYDRQHGRPENLTIDVFRMYERFEP